MRARYFYGYNIVAAGFIIQAVGVGAMFTYGVFFKEFQTEFGWSRAAISGASSLAFLMMGLVGIIAGKMNDRIGPKAIIVISGILLGLGYLLMSRLQTLWQLYLLYGILVGIGFSTHDVITLSTVARWFIRRRGMMSGIVKVGTGSGQFLVPLIATLLIAAGVGVIAILAAYLARRLIGRATRSWEGPAAAAASARSTTIAPNEKPSRSGSSSVATRSPTSCRAANNNALVLRALWSTSRRCCSPTNQRATWTVVHQKRS